VDLVREEIRRGPSGNLTQDASRLTSLRTAVRVWELWKRTA
jgi:hypothetical protein